LRKVLSDVRRVLPFEANESAKSI